MMNGFEYQGNSLEFLNYIFSEEDEQAGNPYNCSFQIKVVSGEFAGLAECEYSRKEWNKFILELEQLYKFEKKKVVFKDICYGSEILFVGDMNGHINVTGILYGRHMTHSIQFEFEADQTILPSFISDLKKL